MVRASGVGAGVSSGVDAPDDKGDELAWATGVKLAESRCQYALPLIGVCT
jgi:hypothetical protein